MMKQRLKQALSRRQKLKITHTDRRISAVLVPIFYKQDEYHLLFTKRTETLRAHRGQISFPGGVHEEHDNTLLDTALRECFEEIGLTAGMVEVLGELDDTPTKITYYLITPFVATIPYPLRLKLDPVEVDEIIEVPISALLDKDCFRQEDDPVNDGTSEGPFYYYDNRIIWGATARIITQFLEVWTKTMGDKT
jgi:8-oxo-dGTP pyrophosphatase MutT (NUDIX family)